MSNPIEIAVDTNVLLDLADGNETVLDCLNLIRERIKDPIIVVLPAVIQELAQITDSGDTAKEKGLL